MRAAIARRPPAPDLAPASAPRSCFLVFARWSLLVAGAERGN